MFYAQQASRLIDRLIGYKWLESIIMEKYSKFNEKGQSLSGGRVQSVVNRLIIDRENEILKFNSDNYFKTIGKFKELTMDLENRLTLDSEWKIYVKLLQMQQ